MRGALRLLWHYIRDYRTQFALLMTILLVNIGLQVAIPQITRYIIDAANTGVDASILQIAAVSFIVLAIVAQVLGVAATYVGEWLSWTATNQLRADLALHCLQLDMTFHNNTTPGKLVERIDTDVLQVAQFFSRFMIIIFGNIVLVIAILGALFIEDWRIGLAMLGFAVFTVWILYRLRNIAVPAVKAFRNSRTELFSTLEEHLAATEDLQANGAFGYVFAKSTENQQAVETAHIKSQMRSMILGVVAGLTLTLGFAIAFSLGYNLFQNNVITIGVAYLVMSYTILLTNPLRQLSFQIERFQQINANIQRITELFETPNRLINAGTLTPPNAAPTLSFDNVNFAYQLDDNTIGDDVLHHITFELPAGKTLGLLGHTGSGKTTLSRLIVRLYDPTSGHVRLNGIDLRDYDLDQLRKKVGIVTQDVQLFRATIRDNLTFFDKNIQDEQLRTIIEQIGLKDWFDTLPQGLDTFLKGDAELSGGQAQLLAFARVFLLNPELVIFDEAVSRLDPITERHIERATTKLFQERTVIIIAHRLTTIEQADQLLILEDGHVIEQGAPNELRTQMTSYFNQLLQVGQGE